MLERLIVASEVCIKFIVLNDKWYKKCFSDSVDNVELDHLDLQVVMGYQVLLVHKV